MDIIRKISHFAGQTFGIWVIVFAVLGFSFPSLFTWISSYITIFLGIIMFGMGLTLQADDFKELVRKPWQVIIGVIAQYTIMPLVAFGLAFGLHLPAEIAVGVILVGCCPGGTASNVMTFLAKGNTALSVAVTTISTLLAPVVTPLLIMLFAKEWLPVSPGSLFISILQAVLFPIIAGLIVKMFFRKQVAKPYMPFRLFLSLASLRLSQLSSAAIGKICFNRGCSFFQLLSCITVSVIYLGFFVQSF